METCSYYQDDKRFDGNIKDLTRTLRVNCAGYDSASRRVPYQYIRKDYYLQLMDRGHLTIGDDGTLFSEQQFIIHRPNKLTIYQCDSNFQYYWIHFTGSNVEQILKECGLKTDQIYTVSPKCMNHVSQLFSSIFDEFTLRKPGYDAVVAARCHELLAQLYRGITEDNQHTTNRQLYRSLHHIHSHLNSSLSVSELAHIAGMSISNFRSLFHKSLGCSPRDYILNLRLDKASVYLLESNLRISEIAPLCGFQDPLYFTRVFTKRCGVSPTQFRKSGASRP